MPNFRFLYLLSSSCKPNDSHTESLIAASILATVSDANPGFVTFERSLVKRRAAGEFRWGSGEFPHILGQEPAPARIQLVVKYGVIIMSDERRVRHRQHQEEPLCVKSRLQCNPVTITINDGAAEVKKEPRMLGNVWIN